jgi:transposase
VSISVSSRARRAHCPICGRGSSRVHSRYSRTVSDLPWHGISVGLEVRARRFFCDEPSCGRPRPAIEAVPGVRYRDDAFTPVLWLRTGVAWTVTKSPHPATNGRFPSDHAMTPFLTVS